MVVWLVVLACFARAFQTPPPVDGGVFCIVMRIERQTVDTLATLVCGVAAGKRTGDERYHRSWIEDSEQVIRLL